jgi:hypothetical protein
MKSIINDTKDRIYYSLMLAPASTSGFNVCSASGDCEKFCVSFTGKGGIPTVQKARIRKTLLFMNDRATFFELLENDICQLAEYAHQNRKQLVIRLNTFSDLAFELIKPELFKSFHDVLFIDYTKRKDRILRYIRGLFPKNYFLAYSHNEKSEDFSMYALQNGVNVSFVVRRPKQIPLKIEGFQVTDADYSDSWIIDNIGTIGVLKAKGKLINADSPFVLDSFDQINAQLSFEMLSYAI